jgi:hypothetical protein
MAAITSFYPYIVPHVPGCPSLTVDVALRSSLIEFCERSLIIQRDHDPVSVVQNIADYDFEPPIASHLVVKIMRAWYKGFPLAPISPDEIANPTIYNHPSNRDSVNWRSKKYFSKRRAHIYRLPNTQRINKAFSNDEDCLKTITGGNDC